ncbi:hypothetical protein B0H12DRAFT_1073496 [Mycena haematopus]|nr:hypothetical protein B0H12DRAFT_1073496 [Mycena haematopus]
MHNLAFTYNKLGQLQEAERLGIEVLGSEESSLTSLPKAKRLYVVVLEKRRKLLGDDHLDTLASMHNLAALYVKLDQFQKAEEMLAVLLEKWRKLLGDDYLNTLTSMQTFAAMSLGEAEELLVVVLEKRQRLLGDNHPDTQLSMEKMYLTYCSLDKQTEAAELQKLILKHL